MVNFWSQALESLASVTSLAVLNVMDCSVSDEAVVALRKALPRLAVSHTRAPEGYWELILTDTEVRARHRGAACSAAESIDWQLGALRSFGMILLFSCAVMGAGRVRRSER
jgi:hypothetical protein